MADLDALQSELAALQATVTAFRPAEMLTVTAFQAQPATLEG